MVGQANARQCERRKLVLAISEADLTVHHGLRDLAALYCEGSERSGRHDGDPLGNVDAVAFSSVEYPSGVPNRRAEV